MPREIPKIPTPPKQLPEVDKTSCLPNRQQTDYTDLKLKTLSENIAKLYVPYKLKNSENVEEITIDNLSNEAYLYVDDNGKPSKVLITTVLKKEIQWEDLSEDIREQLQAIAQATALKAGNHITIENNMINADIGVETVNGKTGNVVLTAADVGALPNTVNVPKKLSDLTNDTGFVSNAVIIQEIDDALETLEVDGGRV